MARRSIPSITSTTNRARCFSGSHSSTDGGRRNPVWRSIVRKLFIGTTFAAMENHCTDSIPNYPVKSDRLLDGLHGPADQLLGNPGKGRIEGLDSRGRLDPVELFACLHQPRGDHLPVLVDD